MQNQTLSPSNVAQQLTHALSHFHGSDRFTRVGLRRNDLMTDGVRYLAENAGAFWLAEAVASYQGSAKFRSEEAYFQEWHIAVSDFAGRHCAVLWCNFGSEKIEVKQVIPFTDFPLAHIEESLDSASDEFLRGLQEGRRSFRMYACRNELDGVTIMLPSEY